MMELKRSDVPRVPAKHASSAVVLDENLLDTAPTTAHSLRIAAPAAIPLAPAMELRDAVPTAPQVKRSLRHARRHTLVGTPSEARSQPVLR
jgi:hypothetical protein